MKIVAHTDGGSRKIKGTTKYLAAIGVVFDYPESGGRAELSEFIGQGTNNEAEYKALITALEWAIDEGAKELQVFMDSELVVRQITGEYAVSSPQLLELYKTAFALASQIPLFKIQHVYREDNADADKLVNEAFENRNTTKLVVTSSRKQETNRVV